MTQRRRARMLAVFVMAMGLAILAREGSGGPTPTFNPKLRYEPLSGDPDDPYVSMLVQKWNLLLEQVREKSLQVSSTLSEKLSVQIGRAKGTDR
jgi:hypothetical protein